MQTVLKSRGHPWTLAKSFRGSCPIASFVPCSDVDEWEFVCEVNGEERQRGHIDQMLCVVERFISLCV